LAFRAAKAWSLRTDLLAAAVGIEHLREKGPKGRGFAEHSLATQGARGRRAKYVCGNERAKTLAQLREGFAFEFGDRIEEFLTRRARCSPERL
jgi:hypothetical protein